MRINKLFSNYGICSRKETNKLIEEKRIKVNGKVCVLGQWVESSDEILLDNKSITKKEMIYIAFNKPVGIICTAQREEKDNIIDFIKYPQYIFPVGRLDKESQGLIIMTNDGDLANEILECENIHEKEYIVKVDKDISDDFINKLSNGIEILCRGGSGIKRISDSLGICKREVTYSNDENFNVVELKNLSKNNKNKYIKTRPCFVNKISDKYFSITLTQGLNKQIRKMCRELGYKVIKLKRVRIMNIKIDNLKIGEWRHLQKEEIIELKNNI